MTNAERAKQFMPFAALKGFEDALKEAEFVPQEKILLGEDAQEELDRKLRELTIGDVVTVTYYADQQYMEHTGPVIDIDPINAILKIAGTSVSFVDFCDIRSAQPHENK